MHVNRGLSPKNSLIYSSLPILISINKFNSYHTVLNITKYAEGSDKIMVIFVMLTDNF